MKPKDMDVKDEMVRSALLALAHDGAISPRAVVDAARDTSHPLHEHFEWDDEIAGESYRLAQAGTIIRRCRYTILRQDKTTKRITVTTTRALQSRPSMRKPDGGYESIDAIMADEDKRKELLESVLRELNAYRKRYNALVELELVWRAVDDVMQQVAPKRKDGTRPDASAVA